MVARASLLATASSFLLSCRCKKFSELVRLLEQNGFQLVREKDSIRYYAKAGRPRRIMLTAMAASSREMIFEMALRPIMPIHCASGSLKCSLR